MRTSLGSSRFPYARIGSSSFSSIGISFKLCTARSIRPSMRARSSSLTNRPFPPIFSRLLSRILSPVVFIVMISISASGSLSRIRSRMISACRTASALSLLPIRITECMVHHILSRKTNSDSIQFYYRRFLFILLLKSEDTFLSIWVVSMDMSSFQAAYP